MSVIELDVVQCPRCGHEFPSDEARVVSANQLGLFAGEPVAAEQEPLVDVPFEIRGGDPAEVHPSDSRAESQAGLNGPSGSPTSPPRRDYVQERLAVSAPKPPYRVPTMVEVASTPASGLSVLSTFSGCGGSCLGFKMAGFRTVAALEFVPAAVETYRANFPDVPIVVQDVRDVEPALLLERFGLARGELDVLEGSPPCSSFSTAGRREEGWGKVKRYSDTEQRTDDLFDEYVRLVEGFRPRVFVAENVPGFLAGAADHFRGWVETMLRDLGYLVWHQVLDAAALGVPQRRRRVIIVGVRRDVAIHPAGLYPTPLPYRYSFADAVDGLVPTPAEWDETSIERFAIGEEWRKLGPGEQSERYFSLVLPALDEPLPTLTQTAGSLGAASVVHPTQERKLTVREARRLCGFPEDFVLTGTYQQRIERLGRAVPPPMMRAVAERIRDALLVADARVSVDPWGGEPS